jgi:hypothetical protein
VLSEAAGLSLLQKIEALATPTALKAADGARRRPVQYQKNRINP